MEYRNKKLEDFEKKLKSQKVAVIGLGVSNIPLIEYLHQKYADVTVFDDRFSGYDPDEGALVIYHRHEVLINGAIQEIFHIGICMDWFIGGATWDRHDRDSFCFLDVVDICTAHAPEEISL